MSLFFVFFLELVYSPSYLAIRHKYIMICVYTWDISECPALQQHYGDEST